MSATKKKHIIPLSVKILLPLCAISLTIIATGWVLSGRQYARDVEKLLERRAESIANNIEQFSWIVGISPELTRVVDSMGAAKDIEIVAIFRRDPFDIVAASGKKMTAGEMQEAIKKNYTDQRILDAMHTGASLKGNFLDISDNKIDYLLVMPVLLKERKTHNLVPGVIYIQSEVYSLTEESNRHNWQMMSWPIIGVLCMAAATYWLLQYYVFLPVNTIKNAIILREQGDISAYAIHLNNDEIGEVGAALNAMLDTLERKKRELLQQKNFLNIIIEHIPLSFFAKDVTDNYRWIIWNKKASQDFGHTAEQVIGKTDYDMFPKEEADFFHTTDEAVMRGGTVVDIPEEPVTTSRGTWTAHTIKVPVYDEMGNPMILIGILEDISERKHQRDVLEATKDSLYDERNRLQTIMDSMLEGIITIDTHGIIHSLNPGAEKMFGYSKEELLGTNVKRLMPEPDKSKHDGYLENYTRTNEARIIGKNRELIGARKNGESFPMTLSVKNLTINNEVQFIGLARDITEQKMREHELENAKNTAINANALKSEFLSNISHELRTPMHSIITFSRQGIERIHKWNLEEHEENLMLIHGSGERLLLLLNALLDLSKLEAGIVKYDIRENNLNQIIKSAIRGVRSLTEEKKLTIDFPTANDTLIAECDSEKMSQVIINLLSNAIKFTPDGKNIQVKTVRQEECVLLTVSDEGIGIPENEVEHIFDKFIQSSKTKTGAGGTGLGLAICREIILGHGGKIWAENTATGGALFSVQLPITLHKGEHHG